MSVSRGVFRGGAKLWFRCVTRVLLDDIMDDVSASAPIKQRGTATQTVRRKSADSLTIVIRI